MRAAGRHTTLLACTLARPHPQPCRCRMQGGFSEVHLAENSETGKQVRRGSACNAADSFFTLGC
jgi:hypothetical protein